MLALLSCPVPPPFPLQAVSSPTVRELLLQPGADCVVRTSTVLDYFGIEMRFWVIMLILVGYLGVLHAASYAALLFNARRTERR